MAALVDGHWVLGKQTLSELGDRSRAGALFFNSADIITGALALLFAIGLYRVLSTSAGGRLGSGLMVLASLMLIGIGIFPIDTGTPHTVLSYSFFATAALALFVLIPPIWKSHVFHHRIGAITAVLLLICVAGAFILNTPSVEALSVSCLLLWMGLMSVRMLWYHPSA
jgi:hypothetical membrane protein